MKNIAVGQPASRQGEKILPKKFFIDYIFNPFKSGLLGFTTFFSVLIMTKLFSYWIGTYDTFTLEADDVFLSSIGFVLVALIKFLENFKHEED